jgi:hypothetical protein
MEEGASAVATLDSGHQLVSSRPRNMTFSHVTYSNSDNVSNIVDFTSMTSTSGSAVMKIYRHLHLSSKIQRCILKIACSFKRSVNDSCAAVPESPFFIAVDGAGLVLVRVLQLHRL